MVREWWNPNLFGLLGIIIIIPIIWFLIPVGVSILDGIGSWELPELTIRVKHEGPIHFTED